jgi:hypothetical protein
MSTGCSTLNTGVTFDSIKLNVGDALSSTGIFVAPTPGIYDFADSGISEDNDVARVLLQMKTATTGWTRVGDAYGNTSYQTFTLHSGLQFLKDDQIRFFLTEGKIHEGTEN